MSQLQQHPHDHHHHNRKMASPSEAEAFAPVLTPATLGPDPVVSVQVLLNCGNSCNFAQTTKDDDDSTQQEAGRPREEGNADDDAEEYDSSSSSSSTCFHAGNCQGGNGLGAYELMHLRGLPDQTCMPYYGASRACVPANVCSFCDGKVQAKSQIVNPKRVAHVEVNEAHGLAIDSASERT